MYFEEGDATTVSSDVLLPPPLVPRQVYKGTHSTLECFIYLVLNLLIYFEPN